MTLVYFVTLFYATIPQTHEHCADDKKIIVNADPGINIFWQRMEIYYKFQRMTQSKCVGELLESLVSEWDSISSQY